MGLNGSSKVLREKVKRLVKKREMLDKRAGRAGDDMHGIEVAATAEREGEEVVEGLRLIIEEMNKRGEPVIEGEPVKKWKPNEAGFISFEPVKSRGTRKPRKKAGKAR